MAFDSTGARVLLFDSRSVTTWSWNGASWVQIAAFGPPARDITAMTAAAGPIVLFGSSVIAGVSMGHTGLKYRTSVQDRAALTH